MKLFVWLGNPWAQYENTRHNIWFKILDQICSDYNFSPFELNKKYNAYVSEWNIWMQKIIAIKPQTFMNLSWESVSKPFVFYKLQAKDILVFQDDIDIDKAKIRLKFWWKNWWHNGIRDIENKIWSSDFWRLKIWVWRPENASQDISSFVLSNFFDQEFQDILNKKCEIKDKINEFFLKSS